MTNGAFKCKATAKVRLVPLVESGEGVGLALDIQRFAGENQSFQSDDWNTLEDDLNDLGYSITEVEEIKQECDSNR
jgi:hypothetical protein